MYGQERRERQIAHEYSRRLYLAASGSDIDDLPTECQEWVAGLAHDAKREWATAYLRSILFGAPAPDESVAGWAVKARKRADSLFRELFASVPTDGAWTTKAETLEPSESAAVFTADTF